jgi:hypothetical protein
VVTRQSAFAFRTAVELRVPVVRTVADLALYTDVTTTQLVSQAQRRVRRMNARRSSTLTISVSATAANDIT